MQLLALRIHVRTQIAPTALTHPTRAHELIREGLIRLGKGLIWLVQRPVERVWALAEPRLIALQHLQLLGVLVRMLV